MKRSSISTIILLVSMLACLGTGIMLHLQVIHRNITSFTPLTFFHLGLAAVVGVFMVNHVIKHVKWFKAYGNIRWGKKTLVTIMSVIGTIVIITGALLIFIVEREVLFFFFSSFFFFSLSLPPFHSSHLLPFFLPSLPFLFPSLFHPPPSPPPPPLDDTLYSRNFVCHTMPGAFHTQN